MLDPENACKASEVISSFNCPEVRLISRAWSVPLIKLPRVMSAVDPTVATLGSKLSVNPAAVADEALGPKLTLIFMVPPGSALPDATFSVVNCAAAGCAKRRATSNPSRGSDPFFRVVPGVRRLL